MIKVFRSDLNSVAFDTESLDFYPLPDDVADCLSGDELTTSERSSRLSKNDRGDNSPTAITRLVLLIAQTCNLKCSYCFSEVYMGSNADNRVMSPATACAAIEKAFRTEPERLSIAFFGGEPLIGFHTIKEAVRASEEYCLAHQAQAPTFEITTNGTLIDRKMTEFFKAHDFSVIISLDGPRHINDKQRPFSSGKGTYDVVKKNIDLLRGAGVVISIEAVFTDNHTNCRETVESTYGFLCKLGARDIFLTPAMGGSPEKSLGGRLLADLEQSYTASTERIMDSWLTDSPIRLTYWLDIVRTLLSRKGKTHFCGAGCAGITVDCSGRVFPCYNLISDGLSMGSVHGVTFPGQDFRRVTALMRQTSKDSFPKCVKCWAKKLCSPCYGDTFGISKTLSAPGESICTIIRAVAKTILLKVAEFIIDGEKWGKFVGNLGLATAKED